MPTYAYECTDCGNAFEAFQKMSDNPLTLCEACGGELRKRMFPVGIVFKGSGFYVNDYAKKGKDSGSEPSAATKAPDNAPAVSDAKSSQTKTTEAKAETPSATPKPTEKSATAKS